MPLKHFSILWIESECARTQQKTSSIVLGMLKKKKRQLLAISMSLLMLSVEIIFNGIERENEIKNSV